MPTATATATNADALPTLREFFAPGGVLAQSSLSYEHRAGQFDMAKAVEKALEERRHLIVEAGTGTGKTLAYLLPALRMARDQGKRVIVSTGTKNLQEQLFFKDIPFLESLLGPLRVTYMKGRGNYICKQKLYALQAAPLLSEPAEVQQFHIIREWEKETVTGDRAEIAGLPEPSLLFSKLDARSEACLGQTCPNFEPCWITQMRKRALESDLIIVNHHLFFADLNIKQQAAGAPDAGVLPDAAAVIFDEAHELEHVAGEYFGVAVSQQRCEELARDTELLLKAKKVSIDAVQNATNMLRERSRMFFGTLPQAAGTIGRQPFHDRAGFLEERGEHYATFTVALERLYDELDRVKDVEESAGLRRRATDLRLSIRFLMESDDPNTVFWIERRAGGGVKNATRTSPGLAPQLPHPPAGDADRRIRDPADAAVHQLQHGGTHQCDAHRAGRLRPHSQAAGPGRRARADGAIAFSVRQAGTAVPAAVPARPARQRLCAAGGGAHAPRSGVVARTCVLPVHQLCADARDV